MMTSKRNHASTTRLPAIVPNLGDLSQRQQQQQQNPQGASHRPLSSDSSQSIDNAYSLEHLFTGLYRRIRRAIQNYNAVSFHDALKVCARVFQSYASYNLNTIDEFARRLTKNARENKKVLLQIEQFHHQLAELRRCHSIFEAELLVTTLVIDFHENDLEQQSKLPIAPGKFSPRSRLSKVLHKQVRQAMDVKSQLRQTNEHLQILLSDEFNANLSDLWEESEKYIATTVPFHDHHMTYILRLVPDVVMKFEYALQLCKKLFELETIMLETYPQINNNSNTHRNPAEVTPVPTVTLSPRSDFTQLPEVPPRHNPPKKKPDKGTQTLPIEVARAPPTTKAPDSPPPQPHRPKPVEITAHHDDHAIYPPLFASSENAPTDQTDQIKLRLLLEQLDKRLADENVNRERLLNCIQQTAKKYEQFNQFSKPNLLTLVMSDDPAAVEYQKALCSSDCNIYKSIEDELTIALREVQHRIDWIEMVRQRTHQWLDQQ